MRATGAMDFGRRIVEQNKLIVPPNNLHDTVSALVWHAASPQPSAPSAKAPHVALGAAAANYVQPPRRHDVLAFFWPG